ncbi:DnaD domain-containing protein [Sediminibacillus massiliensis]|uniref:DnaD domain-containing protein n=1 Tax=Sediminibacillus massiliensis TaxID=1926277 RepID=UPI00098854F6|nr:DnaD domain-containing protein [Sediminibacillus massiliensis]
MSSNRNYQSLFKDQLVIPSLILQKYHAIGLTESEVMVILHIHRFQMNGNYFPTPVEIAQFTTLSDQECSSILRKLIQKNLLLIEQEENDRQILNECYSLEPLWESLYNDTGQSRQGNEQQKAEQQTNIFILFEQEFGRPLSPFEIETVNIWIDQDNQEPSLIKAALREAVLMGKLNFRYIDRILGEWKKKGIKSVEQARKQSKAFHVNQNNQQAQAERSNRDVSLYYNWLEED